MLVLERGYFDDKPQAIIPAYASAVDESVMMRPTSVPIVELNGRRVGVAVAAVVGGGSGMIIRFLLSTSLLDHTVFLRVL